MKKYLFLLVLFLLGCDDSNSSTTKPTKIPDFVDPYGNSSGFIQNAKIEVFPASKFSFSKEEKMASSGRYKVFISFKEENSLFLLDDKDRKIWRIRDEHINIWEIVKIKLDANGLYGLYWEQSSPQLVTTFNFNIKKHHFVYIRPMLAGKYGHPPLRDDTRKEIDRILKEKPILDRNNLIEL